MKRASTLAIGLFCIIGHPTLFAQDGIVSEGLVNAPPEEAAEDLPEAVDGLEKEAAEEAAEEEDTASYLEEEGWELFGEDDDEDDENWPAFTPFVAPLWLTPIGDFDGVVGPGTGLEGGFRFSEGVNVFGLGYFSTSWGGLKYGWHNFILDEDPSKKARVKGWSLAGGESTQPFWEGRPVSLSFFSEGEVGIFKTVLPDGPPDGVNEVDLIGLPPLDQWKLGGAYKIGARLSLPANGSVAYSVGIHGIQEDMKWGHWLGSRAILGLGQFGLALPFAMADKEDSILLKVLSAGVNMGWFWLNYTEKYNWPWSDPAPKWYVAQGLNFSFSFPTPQPATERSEGFE